MEGVALVTAVVLDRELPLVNGVGLMPDTDPNTKESTRGGEELLQLEVGLFFTWEVVLLMMVVIDGGVGQFFIGGERRMSDNGREVASLMVDVEDISASLLVVLLDGLSAVGGDDRWRMHEGGDELHWHRVGGLIRVGGFWIRTNELL